MKSARKTQIVQKLSERVVNLSDRKHVLRVEKAIGKPIRKITEENPIGYLDDGENVIELRLPRMEIERFPVDICNLPYLKVLDLNYNKIGEIPSAIGKLENLEELYLGQSMMNQATGLRLLPESMGNLRNLRILDLTGHALQKVPKWIGNFQIMEKLLLGNNELRDLPSEIGRLEMLSELQLWSNGLKKLPKTMKDLGLLNIILLSKNRLKEIPNWVLDLSNLEKIDLEENEIKKLPKEIGRMIRVKELNLASNRIEKLPVSFCELKSLEFLDLSGNRFKKPLTHECLEGLKSLKWIHIETEKLTTDAMALLLDRDVEIEEME